MTSEREDYLTMVERQRDEALAMVEKLREVCHSREHTPGQFASCTSHHCVESNRFLVRTRSEMLRENDRELYHADLTTCQERVRDGSRES